MLNITGTPKQIAYAESIIKKAFDTCDWDIKQAERQIQVNDLDKLVTYNLDPRVLKAAREYAKAKLQDLVDNYPKELPAKTIIEGKIFKRAGVNMLSNQYLKDNKLEYWGTELQD